MRKEGTKCNDREYRRQNVENCTGPRRRREELGEGITKGEGHVLGLKGRNLVDNVVWQLDTQPLPLKKAEGQMKT